MGVTVSEFDHGWACKTASRADCSGHCGGIDTQNTGGSRAVWQYGNDRGRDGPPLIASDLVVSPFQVEPPSDVTAIGAGTGSSSFIYVNIVCRCMFLRPLAASAVARQFVTDDLT